MAWSSGPPGRGGATRHRRSPRHPRLGQHYLTNAGVVEKILAAVGARAGDTVLEIGPGRGALTRPLVARGVKVVAVELDPAHAEALRAQLGDGLTVVTADALTVDLGAALREAGVAMPLPLVGNLPYESATPMLRRFVRHPEIASIVVAMVQKEVAERVVARPGQREHGFLSLDIAAHAARRRLFDVAPGSFLPPPKVVSTVVELVPHAPVPGSAAALRLASVAFQARRKTLLNALKPFGRERVVGALAAAGIPPTARAETLGLAEFVKLAEGLAGPAAEPG